MRKGIISKLRHVLRSYYTAYYLLYVYIYIYHDYTTHYSTALHVNGHNIYIGVVKITNKI